MYFSAIFTSIMALVPWTYNNPHNTTSTRSDSRSFSFCGTSLRVLQDFSAEISVSQNTHRKLWDGAFLLAKYLETQYPKGSKLWRRRRKNDPRITAVELGAGCGLVGMAAFLLGADEVRLTDADIEHSSKCLDANRDALQLDASKTEPIRCEVLDWCDGPSVWERTFSSHSFDVVLGSDVIYSSDENILSGLIDALDYLSDVDSLVLFSYKRRGLGEDVFFSMLKDRGFEWKFVDKSLHPKEFTGSDYDIVSVKKT